MYKYETSPLTISEILKSGWKLYKSTLSYVVVWSLIAALIHVIPYHFGYVGFFKLDRFHHYHFSWWGILIYTFLLIPEAFFIPTLIYIMHSVATEQKINFASTFKIARNHLVTIYLAMLLYTIIINLGLVLFVFPAVFLGILFSMYLLFIILEKQPLFRAFEQSAKLVWGNWWQTFFVLVIPYFISYMLRSFGKFTTWSVEWMQLVDVIIMTLIMPYFYGVLLVQFNNLKIIKSLPKPISERARTQS